MRDPGKEPLQITTGDVVALHKQLVAEREAHAAEVLRLRAALKNHKHTDACRNYAAEKRHAHCITECRDSYEYALAADPGPLVAAVEGVVKALEELKAQVDTENTLCEGELLGECPSLSDAYHQANAALATYHAALGGNDGPR